MQMDFNDGLNSLSLWEEFGVVIQTGKQELLKFPARKTTFSQSWRESNGKEYDLSTPVLEDKEVTLQCAFMADTLANFWTKYDTLLFELTLPGERQLYVDDHGKTYNFFYKDSSNWVISTKKLSGVSKIFVKFNLQIVVLS